MGAPIRLILLVTIATSVFGENTDISDAYEFGSVSAPFRTWSNENFGESSTRSRLFYISNRAKAERDAIPSKGNVVFDEYINEAPSQVERDVSAKSPQFSGGEQVKFQPICPFEIKTIDLSNHPYYEYLPSMYEEQHCIHPYTKHEEYDPERNTVCHKSGGFSCIQRNETIFLTRKLRGEGNKCWETEAKSIPTRCECMWPQHSYGDITHISQSNNF